MNRNALCICGERALRSFIDRTTMYRLMLYYLLLLFAAALAASAAGVLSFSPVALLWSAFVLTVSAWLANQFFAWAFNAVTNQESVFITPLILVFVVSPVAVADVFGAVMLATIAAFAMASKYILAIWKRHIFNPVAAALVFSTFALGAPASWWIAGVQALFPFVIIGGLVVVYKLRKFDLVVAFIVATSAAIFFISFGSFYAIQSTLQYSPLFFFMFVMLTEPFTMPNTRVLRIVYGALVGVLFIWTPSIGSFYFSPELALIVGNLFAFFVSPNARYILTFVERRRLANGIYEYVFKSDRKLLFKPGQYLEWTLDNVPFDNRGNRRFFTVASAPEDDIVMIGTRVPDKPSPVRNNDSESPGLLLVGVSNGASAFKSTLAELPVVAIISASSLAGDFTMPKDTKKKLALLAGGIGVTPFVSMARHCVATREVRDVVLLYSNKTESEVAYRDVFTSASRCGWRTYYQVGIIDVELIKKEIPDYAERLFYISGPPGMVNAMKSALLSLGISRFSIKTDFFPGLA